MDRNALKRLNWLMKLHPHDDITDLLARVTRLESRVDSAEDGSINLSEANDGAYIHLFRDTAQTIAVGGQAISWASESIPRFEFSDDILLPATAITIPKDGYYDFEIRLGWDTWTDGGDVWIVRTRNGIETQVWPISGVEGDWSTSNGQTFEEATGPAIPLLTGDTVEVKVDHNDSSTQDLSYAILILKAVEPIKTLPSNITNYRETVLADGPVAYWRLGETGSTATDETGNGHDGTYDNSPTQGVDGLLVDDPDKACDFDGAATDRVSIDQHANLDFIDVDFSVEAWFKPDAAITGDKSIVAHQGSTSPINWGITYQTSGTTATFFGERDSANVTQNSNAHARGETYHIVFTYDAATGTGIIYVNGVEENRGTNTNAMTSSTNDVGIGAATAGDNGADGVIDEVAVYDFVLSDVEVQDHYNIGSGS